MKYHQNGKSGAAVIDVKVQSGTVKISIKRDEKKIQFMIKGRFIVFGHNVYPMYVFIVFGLNSWGPKNFIIGQ